MTRRAAKGAVRLLALAVAAWAIGAGSAQGPADVAEDHAAVRLVHLDPDRGPVNVWLDDVLVFAAADADPTPFARVRAGAPELATEAAPDDDEEAGDEDDGDRTDAPTVASPPDGVLGTITLDAGAYATLLLLPEGARGGADADGPYALMDDPLEALPPAGHASLRLIHAHPDAPELALVVRDEDHGDDAPPPFEPVEGTADGHLARLGPLQAGAHVPLTAGPRSLWLVPEDEGSAAPDPVRVDLRAATAYTLFALPDDAEGSIRVVLVVDAAAPAPAGGERE